MRCYLHLKWHYFFWTPSLTRKYPVKISNTRKYPIDHFFLQICPIPDPNPKFLPIPGPDPSQSWKYLPAGPWSGVQRGFSALTKSLMMTVMHSMIARVTIKIYHNVDNTLITLRFVSTGRTVVCVGRNYAEHARELGKALSSKSLPSTPPTYYYHDARQQHTDRTVAFPQASLCLHSGQTLKIWIEGSFVCLKGTSTK